MDKRYVIKEIIEWAICIIVAVIIALIIKFYLITPTIVQQTSMYPTLVHNQRLILNRTVRITRRMPKKGEIITFQAPSTYKNISNEAPIAEYLNEPNGIIGKFFYYVLEIKKQSYIKRVIALPGDEVELKDEKVYINGEELKEDYLKEGVKTNVQNENLDHFIVPENTIFVMGDNRPDSADSRTFGCIPLDKVEGIVMFRFWPINEFGKVK